MAPSARTFLVGAGLAIMNVQAGGAQTAPPPRPAVAVDAELSWPPRPGPVIVDTSDPAVPQAEEVIEDTPNVFAWSRFQSGTVGGWSYRMFPDGSAIVLPDADRSDADFVVICTLAVSCAISGTDGSNTTVPAIGAPRPVPPADPDGAALARFVAEWILAGPGTPPPPPPEPPPPLPVVAVEAAPEEIVEQVPAPVEPAAPRPETASISEDCAAPDPFFPDVCDVPTGPVAETAPRATTGGAAAVLQDSTGATPGSQGPATRDETGTPADGAPASPSLAERFRLACSVNSGLGLRYFDAASSENDYGKLRVSLGCSARLTKRLSVRAALVAYPVSGQQQPWDPDFTYALNYKATDRITIGYSSYTARFRGPGASFVDSLKDGSLRASISLPKLPLPFEKSAACTLGVGLPDPFEGGTTLSCGFSVTDDLRLSGTAYFYAPGKQSSFNPDYSYTASYRISDRLQATYSNYGNNRWPWNPADGDPPGLLGGSVSLSYKLEF